jgi:hypothetical protein
MFISFAVSCLCVLHRGQRRQQTSAAAGPAAISPISVCVLEIEGERNIGEFDTLFLDISVLSDCITH